MSDLETAMAYDAGFEDGIREAIYQYLPYIHHGPRCFKGGNDNATVIDCTCGLEALMDRHKIRH